MAASKVSRMNYLTDLGRTVMAELDAVYTRAQWEDLHPEEVGGTVRAFSMSLALYKNETHFTTVNNDIQCTVIWKKSVPRDQKQCVDFKQGLTLNNTKNIKKNKIGLRKDWTVSFILLQN